MKVLVLSKETQTQNIFKQILSESNYEYIKFFNTEDTIAQIEENKADTLFIDFNYPGFEGYEIINALITSDLKKLPYIIFLADLDQIKSVMDCLGPLPGDYVNYPLERDEIIARLETAYRMLKSKERYKQNIK